MIKELFNHNNYYFNPYAVPVLLTGLGLFGLGLLAIRKNPHQIVNRAFFYTALLMAGWLFFASLNYFSKNPEVALFWYKYFSYNSVLLITSLSYFFVLSLLSDKLYRKFKNLAWFFLSYNILFVLLNLRPNWIITGVKKHFYGYYVVFDKLGIITIPLWCLPAFMSVLNLIIFYIKEASPLKKRQIRLILISYCFAMTAWLDFFPAIFPGKEIYTSGYISFFIVLSIWYYAMSRYRLMEIDTVFHQTLLWAVTVLFLLLPVSLAIFLSLGWLTSINPALRVIFLTLVLLIFLGYYTRLKPRIDHLFRRRKYDYQKALSEIPFKIGTELELNSLIAKLFKEFKETLYIQNSLLLVKLPENTNYTEAGAIGYDLLKERGISRQNQANLSLDSSLIKWLLQSPHLLEREQIEVDPQYSPLKEEALSFFKENSLEALVPIALKNNLTGLLGLGRKENLKPYTLKDIQLLEELGKSLGVTLDNALHHGDIVEKERLSEELRLGREIQTGLLPKEIPVIEGLNIAGLMEPAKEIGGDYYDYLPKAKDRLAVVIGDVSGKGVAAGLLMAVAKTAIYTISSQTLSPKNILISTNDILYQHMRGEKFMTLLYLEYINQEKKIIYSSAGHEHILHYDVKQNRCIPIKSGGFMLGMLPDIADMLEEREISLSPGDKIILYTDGVTEAENNKRERFGLNQLIQATERHSQKSAQELLNSLYQEVKTFMGNYPQYDDITLIAMEVEG